MEQQLDFGQFLSLKKQELAGKGGGDDSVATLGVCTQSIDHWLQYCKYHYAILEEVAKETNLVFDRFSVYQRAGEAVPVRIVYEANIAAFLNSLHSLVDSFPYLLNLFIPQKEGLPESKVGWCDCFISKYKSMPFYDELTDLWMDPTFNKVKGYVNTIKHRHLIRISNQWDHLEFEQYTYRKPYLNERGEVRYQSAVVPRENVVSFIRDCHNELIPKLFMICDSILECKERELAKNL